MLLTKEGFPEEGELVLCTVTKIQPHSVFVDLDEYRRSALIHISEISPGRIRNIRDFVVEGKKVVCTVLRIERQKGYIDLSLRRVNENQKRNKLNEIKQEQLAEKIVEIAAKNADVPLTTLYKQLAEKLIKKYGALYPAFQDVSKGDDVLTKIGLDSKVAATLETSIRQRIKEPEVKIKGELKIITYAPNGLQIIKDALKKAEDVDKKKISINYEGSGKYMLIVKSNNYKEAEKLMEKSAQSAISHVEQNKGEASFARIEE